MGLLHTSNQMAIFLCFLFVVPLLAADPAENLTDTDEAEFRQGGIAQQLMASSYPAGLYGGAGNAYQQYAAGGTGGSGYVNMLRNLYRPPSLGLTDKVKHWVKSFMNRRQYVKPYYGAPGLQYSADEFGASGKPVLMSGGGYKAISIPLRQLQKYYKPYYGTDAAQFLQAQQPGSSSGVAASSSILNYNSPSGGNSGAGLFASETANAGHFSNGGAGYFGSGGSNSGLFGAGSSSGGLFSTGGNSGLFSSGSDGSSALFATGNGGTSGSSLFSGSPGGIYSSSGNSGSNLFSSGNDGTASALFSASGLYGSSGGSSSGLYGSSGSSSSGLYGSSGSSSSGLYGSSGSSSSGLYHPSNSGSQSSGSSVYAIDSGSNSGLFGSDSGSSSYFGASNGGSSNGGSYGSRAAATSSLLTSLSGSNAAQYGDLYASGASPAASVYSPSSGDHQARGYGNKKQQQSSYGASSSALYVPSGDSMRSPEAYPMKSSQDSQVNSFNVDSSRNSPVESSYSVSFQPAQGKSYSAPYENSGFQPVSFGAEDGFKGKSS